MPKQSNTSSEDVIILLRALYKLGSFILLPLLIFNAKRIITWCIKLWKGMVVRKSRSKLECIFTIPVVLSLSILLLQQQGLILSDPNYFKITQTPVDSPAFLIRNRFRQYIEAKEKQSFSFTRMREARKQHGLEEESPNFGTLLNPADKQESDYVILQSLSFILRTSAIKKDYLAWGHASVFPLVLKELKWDEPTSDPMIQEHRSRYLVGEEFGTETEDRILRLIPLIGFVHLMVLISVGLLGQFRLKARWPAVGMLLFFLSISHDIFSIYFFQSGTTVPLYDYFWPHDVYTLRLEKLVFLRNTMYMIFLAVVVLFDYPAWRDPSRVALIKMHQTLETMLGFLQLIRLQRTTVMLDDRLRKHYWDYYRLVEAQNQTLFSNPEFKKTQTDLRRTHNLDLLIEKSQEALDQAFAQLNSHHSKDE